MRNQPSCACKKGSKPRDIISRISKVKGAEGGAATPVDRKPLVNRRKPRLGRAARGNNSVAPGREIKHEKRLADLIKPEDSPSNADMHIDKAGGLPIKREDRNHELLSSAATSDLIKHPSSDVSKSTDNASRSNDSHQETSSSRTSLSSSHNATSSFHTSCSPTEYSFEKSRREETVETTNAYKHAVSRTHKVIANNTPEMSEMGRMIPAPKIRRNAPPASRASAPRANAGKSLSYARMSGRLSRFAAKRRKPASVDMPPKRSTVQRQRAKYPPSPSSHAALAPQSR